MNSPKFSFSRLFLSFSTKGRSRSWTASSLLGISSMTARTAEIDPSSPKCSMSFWAISSLHFPVFSLLGISSKYCILWYCLSSSSSRMEIRADFQQSSSEISDICDTQRDERAEMLETVSAGLKFNLFCLRCKFLYQDP